MDDRHNRCRHRWRRGYWSDNLLREKKGPSQCPSCDATASTECPSSVIVLEQSLISLGPGNRPTVTGSAVRKRGLSWGRSKIVAVFLVRVFGPLALFRYRPDRLERRLYAQNGS